MSREEIEKKVKAKAAEYFKGNPLKEVLTKNAVIGALWWFDTKGNPEKEKERRYPFEDGGRSYGKALLASAFDIGVDWCKDFSEYKNYGKRK